MKNRKKIQLTPPNATKNKKNFFLIFSKKLKTPFFF
jgi:hypothetical protein